MAYPTFVLSRECNLKGAKDKTRPHAPCAVIMPAAKSSLSMHATVGVDLRDTSQAKELLESASEIARHFMNTNPGAHAKIDLKLFQSADEHVDKSNPETHAIGGPGQ